MSHLSKATETAVKPDESSSIALSRAKELLKQMTIEEKLGQLSQVSGEYGSISENLKCAIQEGRVSSVINEVDTNIINELQGIAVKESRLGIPLLIGRDVIHGFKTIFPIPLGQAATWCKETVEQGARIAAIEAASQGVNWTFAPMIDITRDPRWGRIAESLGEDPYLCGQLGVAMVKGFQTNNLGGQTAIAACAKHFAGYGYSESGCDYSFANISENELRNTVLPPFKMAAEAGVATFMASFSDLNGVPATGNRWLMQQVLRNEWQYKGFVVSDWGSISDLRVHGYTEDDRHSGLMSASAGVDMEMVGDCYAKYLPELLQQGLVTHNQIDTMVLRILQTKFALGLFENAYTQTENFADLVNQEHLQAALEAATKSCVLLKNHSDILPLRANELSQVALIGPLADDGYEQLGTWIFDGDANNSVNCQQAIAAKLKDVESLSFAKGLATSRSESTDMFQDAISIAKNANVAIMVMGEESILSGEAHSRANIDLPGAQHQLIEQIAATNTPIILVVMAGRPLTLGPILDKVDAVLYAWHPGTMGGQAIADLLFGDAVPSGKLPVSFPRVVGQIPIYYSKKQSGRPATNESFVHQNDIPVRAEQTSLGMTANHLDTHFSPQFPFGFGLSYAKLVYSEWKLSHQQLSISHSGNTSLIAAVKISNKSDFDADEIVQLYIRDLVASTTRPVRELKGFKRLSIKANSSEIVSFKIGPEDLGFFGAEHQFVIEKGKFHLWIAANSADVGTALAFELID